MELKDLKNGQSFSAVPAMITDVKIHMTKQGKEYAAFKAGDRTASFPCVMWDYGTHPLKHELKDGSVVDLAGIVSEYKGALQFKVSNFSPSIVKDLSRFEKMTKYDPDGMWKEICAIVIADIDEPRIQKVILDIFENYFWTSAFQAAPAATGMHHAFKGGLLEHTHQMLLSAKALLNLPFYAEVLNKDLCLFGILFHDFGKIFEYSTEPGFKRTTWGKFLGHIPEMTAIIYSTCQKLNLPDFMTYHLCHVVAAHHRFLKWGSPVGPVCPEALFVHYVDNLHGDVFGTVQRIEEDTGNDDFVRHGFGEDAYSMHKKRFNAYLKEEAERGKQDEQGVPNTDLAAGDDPEVGGF